MTIHDLKIWPDFFDDVAEGKKPFELRVNDRKFQTHDILLLREWEPNTQRYSGRETRKRVISIVEGLGFGAIEPYRGLRSGYCILGLGPP